jgi:hypothetical protein
MKNSEIAPRVVLFLAILAAFAVRGLSDTITTRARDQFNGRVEFNGSVFRVTSQTTKGEKTFEIKPGVIREIEMNDTVSNPGGLPGGLGPYLVDNMKKSDEEGESTVGDSKRTVRVEVILKAGKTASGMLHKIGTDIELSGSKKYKRSEVNRIFFPEL